MSTGSILGLAQWVKDLALLWLWCRSAAIALIRPLAWEPPYAESEALKKETKKKERKKSNTSKDKQLACVSICINHDG